MSEHPQSIIGLPRRSDVRSIRQFRGIRRLPSQFTRILFAIRLQSEPPAAPMRRLNQRHGGTTGNRTDSSERLLS